MNQEINAARLNLENAKRELSELQDTIIYDPVKISKMTSTEIQDLINKLKARKLIMKLAEINCNSLA